MGYDPIGNGACDNDTRTCVFCRARTFEIKTDGPNLAWLRCMACGTRQPNKRCECSSCEAVRRKTKEIEAEAAAERRARADRAMAERRARADRADCAMAVPTGRPCTCSSVWVGPDGQGGWFCMSCGGDRTEAVRAEAAGRARADSRRPNAVPMATAEERASWVDGANANLMPHTDRCMCVACTVKQIEVARAALDRRRVAYERSVRERRLAGRMSVTRALVSVACAAVVVEGLQLLRRVVLRVIR